MSTGTVNTATGELAGHNIRDSSDERFFLGAFGAAGRAEEIYFGCADTKGCYGFTEGCLETSDCQAVVTYQGASETSYLIEVQGTVAERDYVAVGFSPDGVAGNEVVLGCQDVGGGSVGVVTYWYSTTGAERALEEAENQTMAVLETAYRDGDVIYCSFVIPSDFTLEVRIHFLKAHSTTYCTFLENNY